MRKLLLLLDRKHLKDRICRNVTLSSLDFNLLLFFFLIIFTLFEVWTYSGTLLSKGPYDRYLDSLWAYEIQNSGGLSETPFPNEVLFGNANGYRFNLIPAILLATLNYLTNVSILEIQSYPIYAAIFYLAIFIASNALYKNKYLALLATILACFFLYPVNNIAHTTNRIVISYTIFIFLLYTFINTEKLHTNFRMTFLKLLFMAYFIIIYSSLAVSMIFFIGAVCLIESARLKQIAQMRIAIIYSVCCTMYYLIMNDFLATGLGSFKKMLDDNSFSLNLFVSLKHGIWPENMEYIYQYNYIDWFFLIYSFAALYFFMGISFLSILRKWKINMFTIFGQLYLSFILLILISALISSLTKIRSSGLSYIELSTLFAPILSVHGINICYNRLRINRRIVYLLFIGLMVSLGILSTIHYSFTESSIVGDVTEKELSACEWIKDDKRVVCSDFDMLSTYTTIAGPSSRHFLTMGRDVWPVERIYYNFDIDFMEEKGISVFILTDSMRRHFVTHFIGSRTSPLLNLEVNLSSNARVLKIYDNIEKIFILN